MPTAAGMTTFFTTGCKPGAGEKLLAGSGDASGSSDFFFSASAFFLSSSAYAAPGDFILL
jgi:hypothetical protein